MRQAEVHIILEVLYREPRVGWDGWENMGVTNVRVGEHKLAMATVQKLDIVR